jgi:hypothetical protein
LNFYIPLYPPSAGYYSYPQPNYYPQPNHSYPQPNYQQQCSWVDVGGGYNYYRQYTPNYQWRCW